MFLILVLFIIFLICFYRIGHRSSNKSIPTKAKVTPSLQDINKIETYIQNDVRSNNKEIKYDFDFFYYIWCPTLSNSEIALRESHNLPSIIPDDDIRWSRLINLNMYLQKHHLWNSYYEMLDTDTALQTSYRRMVAPQITKLIMEYDAHAHGLNVAQTIKVNDFSVQTIKQFIRTVKLAKMTKQSFEQSLDVATKKINPSAKAIKDDIKSKIYDLVSGYDLLYED